VAPDDLVGLEYVADPASLLTAGELRLVEAARRGEVLDLTTGDRDEDGLDRAGAWEEDRIIRGPVISVLCRQVRDDWPVHHLGVRVRGARIAEELNLRAATVTVPVEITDSSFDVSPDVRQARLQHLVLAGSRVPGLLGDDHLRVEANVELTNGFQATGKVWLVGAEIGGQLACSGGSFTNPDGNALSCDGIRVIGDVFLNEGFQATGQVRLLGAESGGQLDCSGGSFTNPSGIGLNLQELHASTLLWRHVHFDPTTRLSFLHAQVGTLVDDRDSWPARGNLDLEGFAYERISFPSPLEVEDRLDWISRDPEFHPDTYERLATHYQAMGREQDARIVAIEKQRRRTETFAALRKTAHRLWGLVAAYGYRPGRAAIALAVLMAAGCAIFTPGVMQATDPAVVGGYNQWIFSLDTVLPVIDFGQADVWLPEGAWRMLCLWTIIAAGWLFAVALVAAVTGTLARH